MIEIPATALILATLLFGFLLGSVATADRSVRVTEQLTRAQVKKINAEFERDRHLNLYRKEKARNARLLTAVREQRRVLNEFTVRQ